MDIAAVILILFHILVCNGASLKEQLKHIAKVKMENLGYSDGLNQFRRFNAFQHGQNSLILGSPSLPSHLPEAEPLLPGHTLIRPTLGMLKSAVKFPHRDWEGGSGVYGNIDNLGITWAGTAERVLYTGFRRNSNNLLQTPTAKSPLIILLLPRSNKKTYEDDVINLHLGRKGSRSNKRKQHVKNPTTVGGDHWDTSDSCEHLT